MQDLIIYINLDKRTDRRAEMEAELSRMGIPESKILRWPAVLVEGQGPRGGSFGCTLSHIGALQHIQSLPPDIQNVIILEDDFNFANETLVWESLGKFLAEPPEGWDLVLLSYHVIKREEYSPLISRALYSHGTAGYMVNRHCLPRLLAVLEQSRDGIILTGEEQFVIDVYWHHFMKNRNCYFFNIPLGYQRESFSDIQKKVMMNPSFAD